MIDTKAFGAELADIVKAATQPLLARIVALEKALADQPPPRDGKDADPAEVEALVRSRIKPDIDRLHEAIKGHYELPPARPEIEMMVAHSVQAAVAAIPIPQDGKSIDPVEVQRMVEDAVAAVPAPQDGKSIDPADVRAMVEDAVATIPVPQDGRDGIDGKDGAPGEKGADGIGLAGALIDRSGNLVVTLTNGETKSLGEVVGRDGQAGVDGAPGRDGIGFDDMTLDYDGERTFTFLFQRDGRIEERRFVVPVVLDRGVYSPSATYAKGDAVTFGGSVWIAQGETKARPDGSSDWRLAVKKGRDGKDAAMKPAPEMKPIRVGGGDAG